MIVIFRLYKTHLTQPLPHGHWWWEQLMNCMGVKRLLSTRICAVFISRTCNSSAVNILATVQFLGDESTRWTHQTRTSETRERSEEFYSESVWVGFFCTSICSEMRISIPPRLSDIRKQLTCLTNGGFVLKKIWLGHQHVFYLRSSWCLERWVTWLRLYLLIYPYTTPMQERLWFIFSQSSQL